MPWTEFRQSVIVCALSALCASCGGGGGDGPSEPAPRATQLLLVTAPSTEADTRKPLAVQPVLQAADATGRPVQTGVTVTATLVNGNGLIVEGGSAMNGLGRATFSNLTLGSLGGLVGPLTLQFSAPGLTPVSATIQLRCAFPPLAIGQTVTGSLADGDCTSHRDAWVSPFAVTTSQPVTAVRLTLDRHTLRHPLLTARGPGDASTFFGWSSGNGSDLTFRAIFPPGRNGAQVSTTEAREAGSYTLTTATASTDLTCEDLEPWILGSLNTAQHLGGNDCLAGSWYGDLALVGVMPGERLTLSVASAAFQPWIALIDGETDAVVGEAKAVGTANITFSRSERYALLVLTVTSQAPGGTGDYFLSVNVAPVATSATPVAGGEPRKVRATWPHRFMSRTRREAVPVWSSR